MTTSTDSEISNQQVLRYDTLLSPTAIRVAELLPSDDPTRIRFILVTYELSEAPPYTALSYACGKAYTTFEQRHQADAAPVRNTTVSVDGCPVLIYENLYLFLSSLINQRFSGTVWIDVICINQDDAREKANQILLMDSIYTSARSVIGWLGPSSPAPEADAFDWVLKTFMPAYERAIDVHGEEAVNSLNIFHPRFPTLLGVDDPVGKIQGTFRFEAACRYLKRAWTYQEIVQASAAVLMCGDRKYSAAELCKFAYNVMLNGWRAAAFSPLSATMRLDTGEPFNGVRRWMSMIRDKSAGEHFHPFMQAFTSASMRPTLLASDPSPGRLSAILHLTAGVSCTDPRDRLYSLLGLARRFFVTPLSFYIPVDYAISWHQLYIITASAILGRSGCLNLLGMVETRQLSSTDHTLPSWVPNFATIELPVPLAFSWFHRDGEELGFDASGSMDNPSPTFEILDNVLVTKGSEVDEVRFVSTGFIEAFSRTGGDPSGILRFLLQLEADDRPINSDRVWKTLVAAECRNFPKSWDDDVLAAQFRNVMIARCACRLLEVEREVEDEYPRTVWQDLKMLFEELTLGVLGRSGWSIEDVMEGYSMIKLALTSPDEVQAQAAKEQVHKYDKGSEIFRNIIAAGSQYKRLYITQKKHLVLGPQHGEVGDRVFVLWDSRALQILRPTGNEHEYKYVGEAYIDGCMNGQLLQGPDSLADKFHEVRIV